MNLFLLSVPWQRHLTLCQEQFPSRKQCLHLILYIKHSLIFKFYTMRFSDLLIINPSSTITSLRVVSLLLPLVGLAIYGKVTIILLIIILIIILVISKQCHKAIEVSGPWSIVYLIRP